MSANSSSSLNITVVPSYFLKCLNSMSSEVIYSTYTFTNLLFFLPIYVLVLYTGFQRRRHRRSAGQTTSHSDFFTYHMVTIEIVGVLGSFVYCLGVFTGVAALFLWGTYLYSVIFPGQTLLHLLTCVERYLAVVHPVTYMRLGTGGVRIRNGSILSTWLLCFGWMGITTLYMPNFPVIPLMCMLSVSLVVISFCCLSVLCVLTRPGPGEAGRDRERGDQSKQRAFHIIMAITGALLLRFLGLLVSFGLFDLHLIDEADACMLLDLGICLTGPSSLVLPLLFLHKRGKLACCRHSGESGWRVK